MRWLIDQWWRLVRFGFRLLYYELSFTYDIVSKVVSLGAWRCWQRTSLDFIPAPNAGTILELAHGTGDLQIDLKERGYATIGFDLSPYMGRIAQRKLNRRDLQSKLVNGAGQSLPFVSGVFPAVIVTFPTSFIFQPATLQEIQRVLQDDGVLIVVLSGLFDGSGPLRAVLEWLYRITGQRSPDFDGATANLETEVVERVQPFGYEVRLEQVQCPRSLALVLIARKK